MKPLALALAVLLSLSPVTALAGDVGTDFSFIAPGGSIPDDGIGVFPLFMNSPPIPQIESMSLDILGLSHSSPMDLDFYLISPFGQFIEIMTDRGDQVPISPTNPVNLTFDDASSSVPSDSGALVSGNYQPEGLFNGTDAGFGTFVGGSGGTDAWLLLVIDDDPTGTGRFNSYRLSGTFVPEPMSVSLLAIGALVALRRPRRS